MNYKENPLPITNIPSGSYNGAANVYLLSKDDVIAIFRGRVFSLDHFSSNGNEFIPSY